MTDQLRSKGSVSEEKEAMYQKKKRPWAPATAPNSVSAASSRRNW
jgi:hypothetical protein